MLRTFVAVSIILLCFCPQIASASYDEDMSLLTAGQPKEITEFLYRLVDCNHWNGEHPYDEERKLEIAQAIERLDCGSLTAGEHLIKERYPNDSKVFDAIEKAKGMVY